MGYTIARQSARRYVMYNQKTGMYLNHDCTGPVKDRTWAWSGTAQQYHNMRATYPASAEFSVYRDGEEKIVG